MNQLWWYASRATGIVATVLVVAALVGGLFFSARNTGSRRSPAWWLDLHNWLGGLALAMTGVHMAAAYLDANSDIDLVQLFVPGGSSFAITWGVLAAYLIGGAVFTSWPSKRLRPTAWRIVHLGSVVGAGLGDPPRLPIGHGPRHARLPARPHRHRGTGRVLRGRASVGARAEEHRFTARAQVAPTSRQAWSAMVDAMTIPPPPGAIPPPPGAPTGDAELAARLARLQQRRQPATTPVAGGPAPARPGRRRHPAAGARAGALVLTVVTTGGLGALMAGLDAAQGTSQALASLPAPLPSSTPSASGGDGASSPASATPTSTPSSATTQAFDGAYVNTRYGPVQVQAQISDGTLSEVAVVTYPDGDGRSRSINARALPELRSEVLTAQQADVDTVSGATYTSEAYRESLQAALDQARANGVSIS